MFIKNGLFVGLKKVVLVTSLLTCSLVFSQELKKLALHSEITHVQPMTGLVFWEDNSSDLTTLGDKCQLEFSYLVYSDFYTTGGVFDWSEVDELLEKTASHGRQAILRFRYTYPGVTTPSVPNQIRNLPDYKDQILIVEGSPTYVPDWSNQTLQDFTLAFFTEFSERFDNDSRLAFLQVGFGSYSEYHLYDGPVSLGETFPSKTYQTLFLEHMNETFKKVPWSISIDAAEESYTPISENDSLKNLNYGLFDDSFLHEQHSQNDNEYNRASWLFFGEERTKKNVAGGELNYYSDYDQENVLNLPDGPWGISFEELADVYNITYMIGNDQLSYQTPERIEQAGMNIGYRYEVDEFSTNGTITEVKITNNGIAPIYYDAYPTVQGIRSSESLKGLSKGESKVFTIDTVADNEQLSIESDRLVKGQEIQFNADLDGEVLVTNAIAEKEKLISIFPNPFENVLTIENKEAKPLEVVIYNLLGAVVHQNVIVNKSHAINTSKLESSVYIVRIIGNDEVNNTSFFVKK